MKGCVANCCCCSLLTFAACSLDFLDHFVSSRVAGAIPARGTAQIVDDNLAATTGQIQGILTTETVTGACIT